MGDIEEMGSTVAIRCSKADERHRRIRQLTQYPGPLALPSPGRCHPPDLSQLRCVQEIVDVPVQALVPPLVAG
jgi:hypothetical protein